MEAGMLLAEIQTAGLATVQFFITSILPEEISVIGMDVVRLLNEMKIFSPSLGSRLSAYLIVIPQDGKGC